MKDQKALYLKSRKGNIPTFVICGNDSIALKTMQYYYGVAKSKGCDNIFLADLELLIKDFLQCKKEEGKIKLTDIRSYKDQKSLLFNALHNELSVFVITAKDICSLPVLKCYYVLGVKIGLNNDCLTYLKELIAKFECYQTSYSDSIEVPFLHTFEINITSIQYDV